MEYMRTVCNKIANDRIGALYPNPLTEEGVLSIESKDRSLLSVDVYDAIGKNLMSIMSSTNSPLNLSVINSLSNGVYHLRLNYSDMTTEVEHLSIQR